MFTVHFEDTDSVDLAMSDHTEFDARSEASDCNSEDQLSETPTITTYPHIERYNSYCKNNSPNNRTFNFNLYGDNLGGWKKVVVPAIVFCTKLVCLKMVKKKTKTNDRAVITVQSYKSDKILIKNRYVQVRNLQQLSAMGRNYW